MTPGSDPLLSLDHMSVTRAGVRVIDDITLHIGPGENVGLIGPNGAGKTTLLRAALGLIAARGTNYPANLPPRARARAAAFLPQNRDIVWPMTVADIVSLGVTSPNTIDIDALFTRLGLTALRHRIVTELSGGEQARVLLARALAQNTPLLIADEPTAALDPAQQIAVMEIFADLAQQGRAVLSAVHDLGLAARHCTRIIVLHDGKQIADGPPKDVLTAPLLAQIFGIYAHLDFGPDGMIFQPLKRLTS